ncbi:hypothetical protein Tco_1038394 [Tanacetum coccineum]
MVWCQSKGICMVLDEQRCTPTGKLGRDSGVSKDAEDDGPTAEDEDPATGGEGLAAGDEGPGMRVESRGLDDEGYSVESDGLSLEEEEVVLEGQQRAVLVLGTVVSAPLGLGYGVLRRRELALEEDHVYNTFEVGHGSRSAPEFKRPERVSTPPSLEWSSGSLLISPSPSIAHSPISSPMIPLITQSPIATPATAETEGFLTELGAQVEIQEGLILDYAILLEELSPALFERSLKHEQERVAMTFGALWRPVLALESWAGQTNAQRAALWHAISDTQGENRELRLQLAEERRARLELAEIVDSMRRRQEPRGDV